MSSTSRVKRAAAAALLAGAGTLASLVVTPAIAHADPQATGPITWCPGQYDPFYKSGPDRPNWDWNICHTYWRVWEVPGNVATYTWEGDLPPAEVPLAGLQRPSFNCGLFYCQDPGGHYDYDPRIPAP